MDFSTEIRVGWVSPASPGTLISNVQNVTLRYGRTKITDTFSAGIAVINGRRPDLLPTISVGDGVNITVTNSGIGFAGGYRVQDFRINYGMVASEDTWEIVCEDAIAELGRAYVNSSFAAGQGTLTALETIALAAGLSASFSGGGSTVSAQTFTNANALDICNRLMRTEQGAMFGEDVGEIQALGRQLNTSFPVTFTDGTIAGSGQKYDQLEFAGIAENYATKTVVEPIGLAAQSAGTGNRVNTLDTYDQTTTQAANLALYVDGLLDYALNAPTSISCIGKTLTSAGVLELFGRPQMYGLYIVFRGTTYEAVIYGGTMTITPADIRLTYNLVGADQTNYLTLGNAVLGTLNNNRLGF